MGCAITCKTASKQPNGHIIVTYSDDSQTEYASLADAYNASYELDSDPALAKKWLVAQWLKADPSCANPVANINGKTCTLNAGVFPSIQVV